LSKENYQKVKLLKIYELLYQNSDEEKPLSTADICERLDQQGIKCDRRTLAEDIRVLNNHGYEVIGCRGKHAKTYYVIDRKFDVPEIKILIDAVQAASFITPKKTDELIDKIANLGGSHRAEILKTNIVSFNTNKHSNEAIYYNVQALEEAITQKKKVSCFYFDLDENGTRVYRKEKSRYIVNPVALVFNEDNYYLVCFNDKYNNLSNYRVDRMEHVNVELDDISESDCMKDFNLADYCEQAFKMYTGETHEVVLLFDASLINVIQDKFGEGIKVITQENGSFIANVKVQISPVFFGWCLVFDNKLRILAPQAVIDQYCTTLRSTMTLYRHPVGDDVE
jgi:predicted DNA-binding transcriptional regulator YafY